MKKKFTLVLSLLLMTGLVYDYNFRMAHTNTGGGPAGHTGSPGDGMNCTHCHSGGPAATNEMVTISSDIPGSGYFPGTTYTITATATKSEILKFGFQMSPQNSSGALLGTLALIDMNSTQLVGTGGKYITHTSGGVSGSGSKTWTFDWTAPASGTGEVTFYGAFNFTNSGTGNSGDVIINENYTVAESSVGISEAELASLSVFPNPVVDEIHVAAKDVDEEIMITIFNIEGRKVLEERHEGGEIIIDVRSKSLNTGVYFMQMEVGGKTTVKKLMVK
jgi:hypothetical protein